MITAFEGQLPDVLVDSTSENGSTVTVQVPHVDRGKCIGCGICEFNGPLNGSAAIRVHVPDTEAVN